MQQIVGRDLRELDGELRAIGIVDGMQNHVDLFEKCARRRIGDKLLAEPVDVAGAGDFVGVLAARIDDGRL